MRVRTREKNGGSPSAVLNLEASVVACVGMMNTKYSSRGRAAGKKTKC